MLPVNVLTEPSAVRGHEREGMVGALGHTAARATPERPATSGTAHPRYWMTETPFIGIIRVVPWNFPPLAFVRGGFLFRRKGEIMKQYIVDAFADRMFEGNAAAVCVMDRWPGEELMLKIAGENALPETAFAVPEGEGYRLRWFAPGEEIDLCGHATLAAAYVILNRVRPETEQVAFQTKSGTLTVRRREDLLEMDFPAYSLKQVEVTDDMEAALGVRPVEAWRARDLVCVLEREEDVTDLKPDLEAMKKLRGALCQVTARGSRYDCVSRTFGPKCGIPEDPVCGSGHCHIIPYWAAKMGKNEFTARQASSRGGTLYCRLEGDRVVLAGRAVLYAECELMLEDVE